MLLGKEPSRKLKILLKYDYILCLTVLFSIYTPLVQGVGNVFHVTNGHGTIASFLVTFLCSMINSCINNTNSCRNHSNSYNFGRNLIIRGLKFDCLRDSPFTCGIVLKSSTESKEKRNLAYDLKFNIFLPLRCVFYFFNLRP